MKPHSAVPLLWLSLTLLAGCADNAPQPVKGLLIVGPPHYVGADIYLNDKHYGKLVPIQNSDPLVDRELSYRYPECTKHDWVGFDLRSTVSPLPPGEYRLRIEALGYYPNEVLIEHPTHPEEELTRLFLEPLTPLPPIPEDAPHAGSGPSPA